MARVFIPVQMRELTGGAASAEVQGRTVKGIIAALDAQFPGIAERLCSGGALVPGLAVSIDGAFAPSGLLSPVGPQSEIHFLPAIGGG